MLIDDGDIIRGLGLVLMYSAWVEQCVDDLLRIMVADEPFDGGRQRWPIIRKLNHAAEVVRRLNSRELNLLPEDLEAGVALFERRNDVVRGRMYAGYDQVDYLQAGHPNAPTQPVTSAELYQLASDFWDYLAISSAHRYFVYGALCRRIDVSRRGEPLDRTMAPSYSTDQ